mmetsp:Transcript_15969/g.17730  ORF Transcript_15969/g.17730 Transcript_15969/m.17730 type:complete len:176 (+) Transcript_15969:54-581(+)
MATIYNKAHIRQRRLFRQGFTHATVLSKKHPKTIVVGVKRRIFNMKYGVTRGKKSILKVHDPLDEAVPGDRVLIKQSRKFSKTKNFVLYDFVYKYKPAEFLRQNPEYIPEETVEPWENIPDLQPNAPQWVQYGEPFFKYVPRPDKDTKRRQTKPGNEVKRQSAKDHNSYAHTRLK